jgi:hypothetical protein
MTEEQATVNAEALAISMGITFYVVRDRKGDFSAVQTPLDDCEIVATIDPPREHDRKLE